MKRLVLTFCVLLLLSPGNCTAGDLSFDSFDAAEAAAKKRAQEYQKKMDEHIQSINKDWEQQQKDLGADSSSPDITKITSKNDGQKSSDSDASKNLEDAVNSSVNKLKDSMISTAGPNSSGFAGGGAGYQWSVKFKDGKYVLSDSYNEAEFNTGKKKETPAAEPAAPAEPAEPENSGQDDDNEEIASKPAPEKAPSEDESAPATTTGNDATPASSEAAAAPENSSPSAKPATPAAGTPEKTETTKAPAKPGVDPAPPNLPPPAVKLVIQHPTDFSEEVFSSNSDSESTTDYQLEKFKIPEDTRIKIAVEVSKDISPEDVSLVITDDEGERAPVTSAKMKNYRHMFRVPSDDKYSASVFINDKTRPGNYQKKLMQVKIPVTKVDFESRTIDNQRGTKTSSDDSSAAMSSSSSTSSSSSSGSFNHSSQGQSQQVDLSDMYSDAGAGSDSAAGSSTAADQAGSSSSSSSSANSGSSSSGQNGAVSDSSSSTGGDGSSASTGENAYTDNSGISAGQGSENGSEVSGTRGGGNADNNGSGSGSGNNRYSSNGDNSSSSEDSGSTVNSENGGGSGSSDSTTGDAGDTANNNESGNSSSGSSATADSEGSSSVAGNSDNVADDQSGQDSQQQGNFQVASAKDVDVQGSNAATADENSASKDEKADDAALPADDDPFIMALSIKSEKHKIFQSFDFLDQSTQMSAAIPAGSEVTFSLNLSKKVDIKSLNIKISDGSQEFAGDLKSMGESFAYVFPKPSAGSFIQLTGTAAGKPFTYRLTMPVTQK